MLDKRNFYINGEWVQPTTPNDLEVINPSNEENCAVISLGDKADVDNFYLSNVKGTRQLLDWAIENNI